MSSICPSCGYRYFGPAKQCLCGYKSDSGVITETAKTDIAITHQGESRKTMKNPMKEKTSVQQTVQQDRSQILKEIDSWVFAFCPEDNSISISTPALQSFNLKITIEDLEEMLETLYHVTNQNKTLRKLELDPGDMSELVERINAMIEEKRSKIPVSLSPHELEELKSHMNEKLRQ